MKMSIRVKVDIDAIKIARKKGLDQNGAAQRFFTHEVRRLSDPYVPKKEGVLKGTAVEGIDEIVYPQIYAKKQYYENRGRGMRGKRWDRRMVVQRGPALLASVVKFIARRG